MPTSYGLIVEGDFDRAVFQELVWKIRGQRISVYPRQCGGIPQLRKIFPELLRDLEAAHHGNPVDRAVVIRDADGKEPTALEKVLEQRIEGEEYAFRLGIRFHAVSQQMDTLLLSDPDAIHRVAEARGVLRKRVSRPREALESIPNPKDFFVSLLTEAGLLYTSQVCAEIAAECDLELIKRYCPSFERFIKKISER